MQYKYLTQEQIDHFMEHGWIKLENAFTKEQAEEWTATLWTRLGMDPNDKSTWTKERVHMPTHQSAKIKDFSPKTWGVVTELLGGEDRILNEPISTEWRDNFIVNLGTPETEGAEPPRPQELDNWHCDGDEFKHFLDSPESAMLMTPLWKDIKPRGGGTFIAEDSIGMVAKYLAERPEGCYSRDFSSKFRVGFDPIARINDCKKFVELTGNVGDVYIVHPLTLHTASKNNLREIRVMSNPPCKLVQPFKFKRDNPEDYSIVERKTLKEIGVDSLDFKATTSREKVIPERIRIQAELLKEEKARLAAINEKQMSALPRTAMAA